MAIETATRVVNRCVACGTAGAMFLYSKHGLNALLDRSGLKVRRLDVRNGVEVYTSADYQETPLMIVRYFPRRLVRTVADMVGAGWRILVLAIRPAGEQRASSSHTYKETV